MGNQIKVHLKTLKRKNGLKNVRYQKQHNYRKATFLFEKTNVKSHRVLATNKSLKALLRAANAKLMALGVSAMYSEQFIESLPELISHTGKIQETKNRLTQAPYYTVAECTLLAGLWKEYPYGSTYFYHQQLRQLLNVTRTIPGLVHKRKQMKSGKVDRLNNDIKYYEV